MGQQTIFTDRLATLKTLKNRITQLYILTCKIFLRVNNCKYFAVLDRALELLGRTTPKTVSSASSYKVKTTVVVISDANKFK